MCSSSSDSDASKGRRKASRDERKLLKQQKKEVKKLAKEYKKIEKHQRKIEAKFGKVVLESVTGGIPMATVVEAQPLMTPSRSLTVMRNHDVDERRPEYATHSIIRVTLGESVELVDGSLKAGLPPPYGEYVLIRTSSGRIGKVPKLCFF